jgi:hypothetical protein
VYLCAAGCRHTGHYEAAETAALEALARGVPGALLERAQLLWVSAGLRSATFGTRAGIIMHARNNQQAAARINQKT